MFLKDKITGKPIHFYNTHFSHVGATARIESAKLIMDTITSKTNDAEIIFAADFNAKPNSPSYNEIISSGLTDGFYSGVRLGPMGTWNGFQLYGPHNRRIDYIFIQGFYSNWYFNNSIIVNNNYLPDHFPVVALPLYKELLYVSDLR